MILTGVRTGLQLQGCRDTQGFDSSSEAQPLQSGAPRACALLCRACGNGVCVVRLGRRSRMDNGFAIACTPQRGSGSIPGRVCTCIGRNVELRRLYGTPPYRALLQDAPCAIICAARRAVINCIGGLVVEYIVAIDVTRVRFPADAIFYVWTM